MNTTRKGCNPSPQSHKNYITAFFREGFPMNGISLGSSNLYQATTECSDSKYKPVRCKGICETTF